MHEVILIHIVSCRSIQTCTVLAERPESICIAFMTLRAHVTVEVFGLMLRTRGECCP